MTKIAGKIPWNLGRYFQIVPTLIFEFSTLFVLFEVF